MTFRTFLITGLLSILPISELRGAIPYALTQGMTIPVAYPYCVILNALVGPIVYLFLFSVHKLLSLMTWYKKLFDRVIERARKKLHDKVERFGYWGVMIFVAIPLPITGAWTGAIIAVLLGLKFRYASISITIGVLIAGIVVTCATQLGWAVSGLFTATVD